MEEARPAGEGRPLVGVWKSGLRPVGFLLRLGLGTRPVCPSGPQPWPARPSSRGERQAWAQPRLRGVVGLLLGVHLGGRFKLFFSASALVASSAFFSASALGAFLRTSLLRSPASSRLRRARRPRLWLGSAGALPGQQVEEPGLTVDLHLDDVEVRVVQRVLAGRPWQRLQLFLTLAGRGPHSACRHPAGGMGAAHRHRPSCRNAVHAAAHRRASCPSCGPSGRPSRSCRPCRASCPSCRRRTCRQPPYRASCRSSFAEPFSGFTTRALGLAISKSMTCTFHGRVFEGHQEVLNAVLVDQNRHLDGHDLELGALGLGVDVVDLIVLPPSRPLMPPPYMPPPPIPGMLLGSAAALERTWPRRRHHQRTGTRMRSRREAWPGRRSRGATSRRPSPWRSTADPAPPGCPRQHGLDLLDDNTSSHLWRPCSPGRRRRTIVR